MGWFHSLKSQGQQAERARLVEPGCQVSLFNGCLAMPGVR